ncbi:MAG: MFS transporter [Coxiella sp. (in: Bacteria)]|nr:MAG: MFS transporter [Coxiella sp. (in: g-proteobacteria)]
MLRHERSAVFSLSFIMAFRMLGLFMILPIFSAYAHKIPGATSLLIGVALGVYGLTQACLQLPFGMLSDKIGRKPIIVLGLLLFIAGSIVAALSHTITGIIIGRAIQGAGAIGSTCIAMVADLTRDEHRSKAMAIIGLTIGMAFTFALVIGPILNSWVQLNGIFWATAIFGGISLVLLFTSVPTPPTLTIHDDTETIPKRLKGMLCNGELLRLDIGVACSHAILMATFIAIPIILTHKLGITEWGQIVLYLLVLVLSFICMVPFIIIAEKKRKMKSIFSGAVLMMALTQLLLLFFHHSVAVIGVILFLFFTAFTLLEASLPSLVSKIAPIRSKGTATGIYSTSQFFGIFVGGVLGGWLYGHFQVTGIFAFGTIVGFIWFCAAITMKHPPYLSTLIFPLTPDILENSREYTDKLRKIKGVGEVAFMVDDNLIYIKADKQIITENELRNLLQQGTLHDDGM